MVCLSRLYHFKFFEGYFPQILLGLFFNTLTQISLYLHFHEMTVNNLRISVNKFYVNSNTNVDNVYFGDLTL